MTLKSLSEQAGVPLLQLIIADLCEGILLFEPNGSLTYANASALAMHGVVGVEQLGGSADAYGSNYVFRYLNGQILSDEEHPVRRVLAGEEITDVVVELPRSGETAWRTYLLRLRH